MMILSDRDIHRELQYGGIEIDRPGNAPLSVQPASIDFHLGQEFVVETDMTTVKVDKKWTYPEHKTVERDSYTLEPYEFALAHTDEFVTIDDRHLGKLEGRSSIGRLGVFVENAGLVDPGFDNAQLTLELYNASQNPIQLTEGMRIVQMTLQELKTKSSVDYEETGKYNRQTGATPSRLYEDFQSEPRDDLDESSLRRSNRPVNDCEPRIEGDK